MIPLNQATDAQINAAADALEAKAREGRELQRLLAALDECCPSLPSDDARWAASWIRSMTADCARLRERVKELEAQIKPLQDLHDAVYNPADHGGWGRQ